MKGGVCKGCGRPIIWIRSALGRSIPCDPEQRVYWEQPGGKQKIVTPNGMVVSATLEGTPDTATGVGYISHWATCPEAASFRR